MSGTFDKSRLARIVFSSDWEELTAYIEHRVNELKEQSIVEDSDRIRLIHKGKYIFAMEILSLRDDLKALNHK